MTISQRSIASTPDEHDLADTLSQLAQRLPLSIIYDVVRIETGEIEGRWRYDTTGARSRLWVYLSR